MVDELHDRDYQAARNHLNHAIAQLLGSAARSVLNAFVVLNRIEYSSPWAARGPKAKSF